MCTEEVDPKAAEVGSRVGGMGWICSDQTDTDLELI